MRATSGKFQLGEFNEWFNGSVHGLARRKFIKNRIFQFFDFGDPASVFEVSDMALLIPEVSEFYWLSGASFFLSVIIHPCFIDFAYKCFCL